MGGIGKGLHEPIRTCGDRDGVIGGTSPTGAGDVVIVGVTFGAGKLVAEQAVIQG